MDCRTARALLPYAKLPGELAPEDAEAIEQHLANCADCRAIVKMEQSFDRAVRKAMIDVPVPDGLSERIHNRLAQEGARVWRRNLLRVAAAAAVLLVAIFAGLALVNGRVRVSAEEFVSPEDEMFVRKVEGNSESVVEFFRSQHGLRTEVPRDFDYSLITNLEVVEWKGKRVARLDFQKGDFRAKILVLSKRDFRLGKDVAKEAAGSSCTVEISDSSADFLFVIVYFGGGNRQKFQPQAVIG